MIQSVAQLGRIRWNRWVSQHVRIDIPNEFQDILHTGISEADFAAFEGTFFDMSGNPPTLW